MSFLCCLWPRAKGFFCHLRNATVVEPRLRPSWTTQRPQGPSGVAMASTAVTPESKPCDEGFSDLFLAEHAFFEGGRVWDKQRSLRLPEGQDVASGHLQLPGKGEKLQHPGDGMSWNLLDAVKAKIVLKLEPRKTDCTLICQAFRLA